VVGLVEEVESLVVGLLLEEEGRGGGTDNEDDDGVGVGAGVLLGGVKPLLEAGGDPETNLEIDEENAEASAA